MSQEVKIGVQADTSGIDKLERSTEKLNRALNASAKANQAAEAAMARTEAQARRLRGVQDVLSREMGRPVSSSDSAMFLDNFERMRTGRSAGGSRVRAFSDFESWYRGHRTAYGRDSDAAKHRRFVMSVGMQGTEYAARYGAPPPEEIMPGGGGGGGVSEGGSGFRAGMQRASGAAMGFGKGMLALAGITSLMSMAGKAIDLATEEAVSADTLKRRMGDLGVDFGLLRDQVRAAGAQFGVTYVEMQRLAQQYTRETGNIGRGGAGSLSGGLTSAVGFSRAYGLDPSEGVQFFATMRRFGIGGDDVNNKKLALAIADAVEQGGFIGKADEVLAAVADFTERTARIALITPNAPGYAGALSGLMGLHAPGLDPAGSAAILNAADAAMRRGGAMGEASMNFSYMALLRNSKGLDPISAQALLSGGLFGTTRGVFGPGAGGMSNPLRAWYQLHGLGMPGLDNTTNLAKVQGLLRQQYGNSPYYLEAFKNFFGLQSVQQAAALDIMKPANLAASQHLLARSGIDLSRVSASGIQSIAAIAGAHGMGDLSGLAKGVLGRSDLSQSERDAIATALKGGNVDALKQALVAVVGTKEQEQTEGQQTRKSIADLENELTRVGGLVVGILNPIRDAVVALAEGLAPSKYHENQAIARDAPRGQAEIDIEGGGAAKKFIDAAVKAGASPGKARYLLGNAIKADAAKLVQQAGTNSDFNIDHIVPRAQAGLDPVSTAMINARRDALSRMVRGGKFWTHGDEMSVWSSLRDQMGQTDKSLGLPDGTTSRQLHIESAFDPLALGPQTKYGRAMGIAQVMPKELAELSRRVGRQLNPYDPNDAILIHRMMMEEDLKLAHGNVGNALRIYNSGTDPRKWHNSATNDYVASIMGSNAVPAASGGDGGSSVSIDWGAPPEIRIVDQDGRHRGSVTLSPSVSAPKPAGT